mmetsp:Transcript_76960/g.139926  ORF Transcript_76960/g.139926 Transcript_76960/m.139926 type:complete len:287 (+) Transcript_76960:1-861(+)
MLAAQGRMMCERQRPLASATLAAAKASASALGLCSRLLCRPSSPEAAPSGCGRGRAAACGGAGQGGGSTEGGVGGGDGLLASGNMGSGTGAASETVVLWTGFVLDELPPVSAVCSTSRSKVTSYTSLARLLPLDVNTDKWEAPAAQGTECVRIQYGVTAKWNTLTIATARRTTKTTMRTRTVAVSCVLVLGLLHCGAESIIVVCCGWTVLPGEFAAAGVETACARTAEAAVGHSARLQSSCSAACAVARPGTYDPCISTSTAQCTSNGSGCADCVSGQKPPGRLAK